MASFSRIPNVIMIDMTRLHYPSIAFSSSLVNGDIFPRSIPSSAISLGNKQIEAKYTRTRQ